MCGSHCGRVEPAAASHGRSVPVPGLRGPSSRCCRQTWPAASVSHTRSLLSGTEDTSNTRRCGGVAQLGQFRMFLTGEQRADRARGRRDAGPSSGGVRSGHPSQLRTCRTSVTAHALDRPCCTAAAPTAMPPALAAPSDHGPAAVAAAEVVRSSCATGLPHESVSSWLSLSAGRLLMPRIVTHRAGPAGKQHTNNKYTQRKGHRLRPDSLVVRGGTVGW